MGRLPGLLEVASLDPWRQQVLAAAREHAPGPPSAEELRRRDSTLPAGVADWQASEIRKGWVQEPTTLEALGAASVEELEALSTPELLARPRRWTR